MFDTIKKVVKQKQLLIFINSCDYIIDYFKLLGFDICEYCYNIENKIAMIQNI
jgi:cytochrome c oxidase subunit IV